LKLFLLLEEALAMERRLHRLSWHHIEIVGMQLGSYE